MAIFQVATNTPPKSKIIGGWIIDQPWGPPPGSTVELSGSFHLDDPQGQVGMQVFVVEAAGGLYQVPLSYRDAPLPGADDSFIAEMEHSVLGTRYVYNGLGDDRFLLVLAGVAATGYGQALGFAQHDGRWLAVPDELIIRGSGSIPGRVPVDGLTMVSDDETRAVFRNDAMEIACFHRLTPGPAPDIGLTTTLDSHPGSITLAEVRQT